VLRDDGFGNLGFYSLALYYCFFGVTGLFAAPIVTKLGERYALVFGTAGYICYTAS
jgi:MFS family permease